MPKSKIIKDIANSSCDLMTSLKRTRVLLQELGDEKILQWINYEMHGYPEKEEYPEYRKIRGELIGTYWMGSLRQNVKYTNVSIPLGKMPNNVREELLVGYVNQSISSLQNIVTEKKHSFCKPLPADLYGMIAKFNNNPYMNIVSAHVKMDESQILNIFPMVETKLMDILVVLEKEFGNLDELDIDVNSKSENEVRCITNNIYYAIYEDASVSIGNNNKIKDSDIASQISQK